MKKNWSPEKLSLKATQSARPRPLPGVRSTLRSHHSMDRSIRDHPMDCGNKSAEILRLTLQVWLDLFDIAIQSQDIGYIF